MKSSIRPSWDAYFMALAKLVASRSTCLSRPTGCVIVKDKQIISTGYNGSMPGVAHCSEEGRCYRRSIQAPDAGKYDFCRSIHAEANAVALASKKGLDLEGSVVYATLFPCFVCTKLLVRAGVKEIIFEKGYESVDKNRDQHWKEALESTGVKVRPFKIESEDIQFMLNFLQGDTSERRIK